MLNALPGFQSQLLSVLLIPLIAFKHRLSQNSSSDQVLQADLIGDDYIVAYYHVALYAIGVDLPQQPLLFLRRAEGRGRQSDKLYMGYLGPDIIDHATIGFGRGVVGLVHHQEEFLLPGKPLVQGGQIAPDAILADNQQVIIRANINGPSVITGTGNNLIAEARNMGNSFGIGIVLKGLRRRPLYITARPKKPLRKSPILPDPLPGCLSRLKLSGPHTTEA